MLDHIDVLLFYNLVKFEDSNINTDQIKLFFEKQV